MSLESRRELLFSFSNPRFLETHRRYENETHIACVQVVAKREELRARANSRARQAEVSKIQSCCVCLGRIHRIQSFVKLSIACVRFAKSVSCLEARPLLVSGKVSSISERIRRCVSQSAVHCFPKAIKHSLSLCRRSSGWSASSCSNKPSSQDCAQTSSGSSRTRPSSKPRSPDEGTVFSLKKNKKKTSCLRRKCTLWETALLISKKT